MDIITHQMIHFFAPNVSGNQEEMETLLLDEDDEDTRNLYDEYLKLKYSNEELKLIGTILPFSTNRQMSATYSKYFISPHLL